LNSDGTITQLDPDVKVFGDVSVRVQGISATGPIYNNLYVKTKDDNNFRQIGVGQHDVDSRSYGSSTGMTVLGDKIYIGCANGYTPDSEYHLYWVDIKTGVSGKVVNEQIISFEVQEGYDESAAPSGNVYYIARNAQSRKGYLYRAGLSGESPVRLLDREITAFALCGDNFYYIAADNNELYRFGDGKAILPGSYVAYDLYNKEGYIYCSFDGASDTPYRKIILDKNGAIIYQSGDYRDKV
jgi:hypothetical protein